MFSAVILKTGSSLFRVFRQEEPIGLNIGLVNTIIEFVILPAIVFLFVKLINRLKAGRRRKEEEPKPGQTGRTPAYGNRDILKERKG